MSGESAEKAQPKDWHSSKHIHKRARHLLDHPDGENPSDVTFLVGDGQNEPQKIFQCHKFILAMVSSTFQAMFYGSFPQEHPIKVPDVTPKAFQFMLRYAYGENVKFSGIYRMGEALDILYCAKKYLIAKLTRTCGDHIQLNMALAWESDPCVVFQRAPLMDEDNLATLALAKIARSTPAIMKRDAFLRLSFDCVKKILDCPNLNARESEVYHGVRRWIEHNVGAVVGKALRDAFGSLLYSIRFPLFGATELADGPVADGALNTEEASSVFQFILGKVKPPVPFLTAPRVPLAASLKCSFRLVTAPAAAQIGWVFNNKMFLCMRPDLAPGCCAFLRQLITDRLHIRIASYDNEHPGKTVPVPEVLGVERNILSYSIKNACWFEWDIEDGTARNIRIAVHKKPHRYHSAVFAFLCGRKDQETMLPFDLFDDKRIQGVAGFRIPMLLR